MLSIFLPFGVDVRVIAKDVKSARQIGAIDARNTRTHRVNHNATGNGMVTYSRSVEGDAGTVGAGTSASMAVASTGRGAGTEDSVTSVSAMIGPGPTVMKVPPVAELIKGSEKPGPRVPDPGPCVDQSMVLR